MQQLPGGARPTGALALLAKALAVVAGAALLVVALMFSLVIFAVLIIGATMLVGYLWWKTRDLRKQMRERPPGGHIIEGEVVHEAQPADRLPR